MQHVYLAFKFNESTMMEDDNVNKAIKEQNRRNGNNNDDDDDDDNSSVSIVLNIKKMILMKNLQIIYLKQQQIYEMVEKK